MDGVGGGGEVGGRRREHFLDKEISLESIIFELSLINEFIINLAEQLLSRGSQS